MQQESTQQGGEEIVLSKFRTLLNRFKRPYIEVTDSPESDKQTVDALDGVFDMMQTLYNIIHPILTSQGNVPEAIRSDPQKMPIISVFDNEGVLAALRENIALKEPLLRYLKLDLLVYPYTLNPSHIDMLARNHIESHQRELVNNKDEP